MKKILHTALLLLFTGLSAVAQMTASGPGTSIDTLSLMDLMNIKITVATITEMTPAQSPAVISTITDEDIRAIGAHDLMDVLALVPGFSFGSDVEGIVGLSVRGNWAHEGKVVLIIDGQVMNEELYSTLQWGHHYPINNIERIEIIRGPGSALYGGYAAYAVINVVTRTAKNKNEFGATANASTTGDGITESGASVYYGSKFSTSGTVSVNAEISDGQRSQEKYTDTHGSSFSMDRNSGLRNYFINTAIGIHNFEIRAIADVYANQTRDEYLQISSKARWLHFDSYFTEINKSFHFGDKWDLKARLQYKNQTPWALSDQVDSTDQQVGVETFKIKSERITGTLNGTYTVSDDIGISAGFQHYFDKATNLVADEIFSKSNTSTLTTTNTSGFVQALWKNSWFNIIAGARINNNSRFASTIVPRIGLTKEFGKYHIKALYNRSFRSPSTQNIDLSSAIKPEKSDIFEVETGVMFTENSGLNLNAYYIITQDPIIYYFDTLTDFDAYTNAAETGTHGIELEYHYKKNGATLHLGGSFYLTNQEKGLQEYDAIGQSGANLGISPVKLTAQLSYRLSSHLQTSFTAVYESEKTGITAATLNGDSLVYHRYDPTLNLNIFLDYKVPGVTGLSIRAGVRNILNQDTYLVQPYNSLHGALPGLGRAIELKLSLQRF